MSEHNAACFINMCMIVVNTVSYDKLIGQELVSTFEDLECDIVPGFWNSSFENMDEKSELMVIIQATLIIRWNGQRSYFKSSDTMALVTRLPPGCWKINTSNVESMQPGLAR